jgi:hypothetical protein
MGANNNMRFKTISSTFFLAALALSGFPPGRSQAPQNTDEHAKIVLDQARAALGGEAALKAIQSLSGSGSFIIGTGEHRASGQLKLDLLLPDMFMRTMKWTPMQTVQITTTEAVNGTKVWTDSKTSQNGSPGGGAMGGGMGRGGSRRGGGLGGGSGGGGGERGSGGPAPELRDNTGSQEFQGQMLADLDCLLAALFFFGPDFPPEGFIYAGEADVDNVRTDSLKITAVNGITFNIALDQKTHRPFMVEYYTSSSESSAGAPLHRKGPAGTIQAGEAAAKPVDIQIYFSDYRSLQEKRNGQVWLPYQINKSRDGQPVEDFRIDSFKLNPSLKPEQFKEKR